MKLKTFVVFMILATVVCWATWFLVLSQIDPDTSGFIGHFAFYISLFFALVGTFGLLGFLIRYLTQSKTIPFRHIRVSIRQSMLFSLLLVAALLLQGQRFLTWYNILFLVAGLTIFEFFFVSKETVKRKPT
ncbi:MAG: hypothetical protein HYV34_04210 [Candidatus Kerfeldbacteria bacterium]|nr:hypothetical protein [Candidatus Kerfeldbacteria bacterium]